jgi:hypothetical protein
MALWPGLNERFLIAAIRQRLSLTKFRDHVGQTPVGGHTALVS